MKKIHLFFLLIFCFNVLNAQEVKLELTLSTESEGVCTEVFEVLLHVENISDVIAENVECRLKLPPYIAFVHPSDTVIRISAVYDNDWEEYYIPLRNTGSFTSSSDILILGQITSCDQVDEEYEYGQWDWTGDPINRLGASVKVPVGHVMSLRDMHITNARICKGDTAILEASADIDYPQRFVWYSQNLQSIVNTEQIYSGSSKCIIPNCKENTTYYVAVSNDDICPIVLPYAYKDVFLNTSTNQRTTVVQHDDNISFYDEGGQNANYTPGNGTWVHTFKTEETSMYVSFDMLDLGVGDVLNIYGSSSPSPSTLLYSYTYGSTPESFRWDNQVLAFEFVQQGGIGAGWKVTIKAKEESKIVSTILLNAENDRGEFFVSFVDSVLFYDEGGEGGLYHPCDNSYTFTAMLGHVLAEFKGKAIQINPGDSLFVYDGDNIYDSQILRVFTRRVEVDVTDTIWFKSSGQSLTFRLKAVGSQGGWRARITMVDMEASFGKATATIKSPGGMSSLINTTDAETCFRSEGTMKASSMVAVPQYYTWYSPDLQRVIKKDTIYNQGDESAYSTRVLSNETYYVQVMNDTICPIEIPYHYSTVLFNPNIPNNVTPVHEYDYISFYDEGGLSEHYSSRERMAKQIFTTDTGNLSVTFNKYFYICSNDTLYIYDGTSLNEESLLQKLTGYIDLEETPQTYQSRSGSLTFVFAQHNCSATGWNAVIKRIRNNRTVTLDALSNGEVTTLEPTEMIDFYDAGGVNGNYSGRGDLIHTFSTNSGFIKADFSNSLINLNYNDILYIYDGDDVNARVLGTYRGSSNTHPVITSTGPSMTFRLVSNSDYGYSSGWHAEISVRVEGALASVNTKLKVPTDDYANVTTTGVEACFGEDVSLVTRSGIDRTQYLTWYSPTLNKILLRDTLHYAGDESSLPVTVTNDENYYVSVTAATDGECPIEVPYTVSIVCLDAFTNGGTTLVTDRDYIRFYDEGGPDGYLYSWNSPVYIHTFTADTGNVEVAFFDYINLYGDDSLSIYDGAEVSDQYLLATYDGFNSYYFDIPQKYRSTRGSLTFRIARRGGCCVSGWEALVTKANGYAEKTILLDEAHNGGVSYVGPADEINFYDAGGEEYEYYIGNNCSYTFTAIQGNIRAEFSDYGVRLAWGDTLFVYNGPDITPGNLMCQWSGDNYSFHPTLVSTGSSMTFYLKSNGSGFLGWKAKIKSDVTNALLPVSVQMKVPVSSPQNITTTNDEVCYGQEAILTAQSNIPGRQYFTWFSPDHEFLFRDTVEQGGISRLTVSINNNATYYASVSTDGECAVAIPQYTIVLLDDGSHNQTTYISDVNNAYFYDGGGDAASYPAREGVLRHTFTAESGQVYALFYGERTIYAPDTLYIYDGVIEDEQHLISAINGTTAWGQIANATSLIQSTTGSLTFVFVQHNNDWGNLGWSALITNKPTKYNTVLLDNVNHGKITPVGPTDIIQFCDDGGDDGTYSPYSRNAQYIHTFKAVQGVIQAKMSISTEDGPKYMSISESDTLFVYDGDTPNDSCIAKFSGYSILGPTLRSTGPSMTFYLKSNDGYAEGWHAEITASPQTVLAEAKVIIKDPIDQRSHIITSDIENCYGAYDTIKAISDIDAPQYFKWYNGQQNLLSRETIQTAGEETKLPVQIFSNETYYVSVASGGECHVAIPDYNIMLLNDSINNGTTILGGEDYILFYDDGGENGSYSSRQGDLIHSFKADGSDIYVTISNNFKFDSNDTLYIYNGLEVNEQKRLNFLTGQRNISTFLVIHPTENGVTFRFAQHGGSQTGWKIRITTIPLRESSVWMNHENHEDTTFVGPVDVVHFYDDGGPNHQYNTTRHEYYHTFTAVQGNIEIDFEGSPGFDRNDTLFFYEGKDISAPLIDYCTSGNMLLHYESEGPYLTVRFKKEGGWLSSGWAAIVTAHPDNLLYPINVNIKKPLDSDRITTIDGEDCYGEDVTMKAYTDLLDYPQTFFWYDSDLNPIGTSVVYAAGEQAEKMVEDVFETQPYYVTVSNGTECPVIIPSGVIVEQELLLNYENNGKTTIVTQNEQINFYDDGGPNGSYSPNVDYTHTFTALQGNINIKFDYNFSLCSKDSIILYDGLDTSALVLNIITGNNYYSNISTTSSNSSMTVRFKGTNCTAYGWWAQVTAVNPEYSMAKVNAKVKMGVPDSITTHDVTVCYGDEVQLEAFSSISATQTFVWYDSDLTTVLATQPVDNIEEGSHITVTPNVGSKYYVTVTNDENCPILDIGGPMDTSNVVRVNVNFYEPVIETDIQVDNVEACYNETVTLRAEADNGEVRHFSWYDENYNLLKDTVGDFATLDIVATTNTIYYINGADPSECSILPPNFGEMQSGTTPVSVQVSIKVPADPSVITTNGPIEVCFGTETTLTASSTLNTQQHFVWLKPDRMTIIDEEDVDVNGTSNETFRITEHGPYYVAVFENGGCPLEEIVNHYPVSLDKLAAIDVTFAEPSFSQNVTTADIEGCNGNIVTLVASNGGETSHFAWYDENLNFLKDTIGEFGTLDVTVTGNATYYVNASAADECPVLPPQYREFLFTENQKDKTTYLTTVGKGILFYDEGGRDNNYYTTNAGWYHTFTASENQHVALKFNSLDLSCCGEYLYVYEGTYSNLQYNKAYYYCGYSYDNLIISDGNSLTVYWRNYNNCFNAGWDAVVGILDDNNEMHVPELDLAAAHVTLKAPLAPSEITTTDGLACRGGEAVLTASANIAFPQTHIWYDEDMNFLDSYLVGENDEHSSYSVSPITRTQNFYVSVSNATECPVNIVKKETINLDESKNGGTTEINDYKLVKFYDTGGKQGSYSGYNTLTHSFTAPAGQQVYVTFSDDIRLNYNDYLRIYNGNINDNDEIAVITYDNQNSVPRSYNSTSNTMTFMLEQNGYCCEQGWEATVTTNPTQTDQSVLLNYDGGTTTVNPGETVNFYDGGGANNDANINGSTSYTHTFTAPSGKLKLTFNNYYMDLSYAHLYVYNGTETNSDSLLADYGYGYYWDDNSIPEFTSSGSSLTVKLQNDYSWGFWFSGWSAEVSASQPELAMVTASIKAPLGPSEVTTTDDQACKGQPAIMTASADIDFPQYYTWYDEDYMALRYDTLHNDGEVSSYTVDQVTHAQNYYVAVSNATECPVEFIRTGEVLLNGNTSGLTTEITDLTPTYFYDKGGKNNGYDSYDGNTLTHTFTAPEGQQVYVTFSNEIYLNYNDHLRIYNGTANGDEIVDISRDNQYSVSRSFHSTTNMLTFIFEQGGSCCDQGWEAIVATSPMQPNQQVLLNYEQNGITTHLGLGETIGLYDNGGYNGSFGISSGEQYTHTFTADQGKVQISFKDYIRLYSAKLSVYDGTTANDQTLLKQWQYDQDLNEEVILTSSGSSLTVKLSSDNYECCPEGWRAEVTALPELAVASVSIKVVDPSSIVTTDDEICYGDSASLTASSEIGVPQYYFWYGPDRMSVLKYDTVWTEGGHSTFSVLTGVEETYYVTVTNDTTCQFVGPIHNNVRNVVVAENFQTSSINVELASNDSVVFYDAGGPDGNIDFRNNNNSSCWDQNVYFIAENGSYIYVHLDYLDGGSSDARFTIYDEENGREIANFRRSAIDKDYVINSTRVRLSFSNDCDRKSFRGWLGSVYAISPLDASTLAEAHVSFKIPVGPSTITADSPVEVCYGSEATLTASSSLDADQYFVWYDTDRMTVLKRDTVHATGQDSWVTVTPREEGTYYVAVTNDDNCPIVEENTRTQHDVVLIGGYAPLLESYNIVDFYDDGGIDNNYGSYSYRSTTFTAVDGSHIRIHIDTISLARRARLRIRDEENNHNIASLNGPLDTANLDFLVESSRVYFNFDNDKSNRTAMGWEGYVYAITPHNEDELVEIDVRFSEPDIVDANEVEVSNAEDVCYGETVTLTATLTNSGSEQHRFAWYDEESNMVKEEVATSSSSISVVVTGETYYYVNVSSADECPILTPDDDIENYDLPYGHITLKAPLAGTVITTIDDEVCFGSEATLTAYSDIAFPQYYTWYAPDRITVMKQQTVNDGEQSTLTVTPDEEIDYYVAISNNENCPIVAPIHNKYDSVTLDGRISEYELDATDSVRFYDEGGPDRNYWTGNSYNMYFTADQGSYIRIHFDTVNLARNAYLRIYKNDWSDNNLVAYITGAHAGLDYIVEGNRVMVYFGGYSDQSAPGWEGYIYAIPQRDEETLAAAHVSFMQPTFNSSLITAEDKEACFGAEAELTAVSSLTDNQYFAWYDGEMNLMKQEIIATGEYSILPVEVFGNATYYVNVSEENECPVLPPHYGSLCLDASQDGRTTFIETGHALNFYDDGGENNDYSNSADNWTHIFKAPSGGHVRIVINSFYTEGCDYLYIYDGSSTDGSPVATLSYNQDGYTYTSTSESLTVKWYSDGSVVYAGWDALIGVPDVNDEMIASAFELKSVNVAVIQPTIGLPITTTNDTVCYGSEAHLTASSSIDYPQYYNWYAPDASTLLLRDTVDGSIKTESSLEAPYYYQYQDQQYYIAVGNNDNCPPVLMDANSSNIVLLNEDADGQTTVIAPNEVVKFYDAGGRQNSYYDHNSDYTHTFRALQGTLMVKFNSNNTELGHYDTLYVYDSDQADNNHLLGKVINRRDEENDEHVMDYDTVKYYSTGQYMTFRFESNDNWREGWDATIMPYNLQEDFATADVIVKVTSVPEMSIMTQSDTVCYGNEAVVSASADLSHPQYYTWYDNRMNILQQDTLWNDSETESVLNLPIHYNSESYYAYIYSDTVSCMMSRNTLPKISREVCLTQSMNGVETTVGSNDSITFISGNDLVGNGNSSYSMRYNFTAEDGFIQIHFDELELVNDAEIEIEDPNMQIEYGWYEDDIYHDLTITSMSNSLQIYLYISSSRSSYARWNATVTNIGTVNSNILSKMAQADVVVELNNSVATVTTTNDTVCIGSPAMLTASSAIGFPQYYTWYNEDMSQMLHQETIESGVSSYYIPGQVGNATYKVLAYNDTTCTIHPIEQHNIFREYNFDDNLAGRTLFVGANDSLVIYDDGGKNGDYTVPETEVIRIIKLETYPGATITAQITSMATDDEEGVILAFVSGDEQGNLDPGYEGENVSYVTGTLSYTFTYLSSGNVLYIGWVVDDDDAIPMAGFEMTITADMHPESYLADANVVMRNRPSMDYNALTDATNDVICQGEDAELEATSNLTENPQYFLWYSSDLSRVMGADTVYSGNVSHVSIPNLMQDTVLYVAVGTDEICPAYPMAQKLVNELYMTQAINEDTTILTTVDSVLFYDEGGPDGPYNRENVMCFHTFKTESGHIVFNIHEISINSDLDSRESNYSFLAVLEGELDEDNIIARYAGDDFGSAPTTITSTGNSLTVAWVCQWYDNDEPHDGWFASIYTTDQINSDISVLARAEVTVNPSYKFEVYDTTYTSNTPYTTADNIFKNIDVSAEGDYVIDSIYHTALGCDSTYTLYLTVLQPTVQDIIIASHSNSWTYDGWYHREEVYTVVYGLDTLTADAGSDGKVFTLQDSGDVLTIIPDATAEVIYYTPTPVPNSFSYTLDNEANYPSLTTDTGTLEITPIATSITITANSAAKFYDGIPLTNDGFSYTPDDILVEGDTLVAEIVGSITEIGDSLNRVVSFHVFRNENFNRRGIASYTLDVTNCYTFNTPESGTLSVVDSIKLNVVTNGKVCPGENDGTADITVTGGKEKTPDRYTYDVTGENTAYTVNGHSDGEINLDLLSADNYTVTITDALGLTATATFTIVERPVITPTTTFDCPADIDTLIKYSGCNLTIVDIGTPNFVAPTGMDMADVTIYNNAPADNVYEVGETIVRWVAKGMCGDSVTCDQIIKVGFMDCPNAVDYENNSYPSVRLGSGCKCWTTENLKSTKYSDSRDIDDVMDYYSYEYPNTTQNVNIFGHLYDWYAAADTQRYGSVDSVENAYRLGHHIQGICPAGWYLPSDDEYEELNVYPTTDLRSTSYWIQVSGMVNTNATGFNSLPGGMYDCSTDRFEDMMGEAYYWTCHPVYDMATGAMMDYICEKILIHENARCNGYSIRCIWGE